MIVNNILLFPGRINWLLLNSSLELPFHALIQNLLNTMQQIGID